MLKDCLILYLKKLKRWLHFSNIYGNYHFILIPIIIFFLFINSKNYILIVPIILLFIYIFLKHKRLFIISLFCFILIAILYFIKDTIYINAPNKVQKNLVVEKIENKETSQKVILKDSIYKYIYYDKDNKMKVGDIYYVDGDVLTYSSSNTPNGFDYKKYLKHQNIIGRLDIKEIKFVKKIFILSKVNDLLGRYYDNNFKNASIIKALVIGSKEDIPDELSKNIQGVGISHLFVVSGLHVGIITGFFEKVLNKIKIKDIYKHLTIYMFLGMYLIVTNFLVSVLRVTIAYIFKNTLKNDYTSLDKMVINILIVLVINPFYAFNYSFILTYLISSMIIIINPILSKKKGIFIYILNTIIISALSVIITLPIVVNISSNINILSIMYNIFYIPFVSYIILPLSIIVSFVPCIEQFVLFIYRFFVSSIEFFGSIKLLTFSLPVLNTFEILLYYILILVTVYIVEKKKWYILILLLGFYTYWYYKANFDIYDKVVFLDVSEGEATHIKGAFNKYNVIIDTGIESDDTIITYLQKQGIRKIDLVIISHGDNDHNGNLEKLITNFKVKCVILSAYDYDTYEILKKNNYHKYILVKRGSTFKINDLYFEVLWPMYDTGDVNNNSIVFKMYYENYSFLFTGDIEEKAENELIKLEKNINVNILKIAHHASNTSTKKKWLECVSFDKGVAMVGDRNTYGFPNKYTMDRLKNKEVYYTNEHDTITFYKCFFKKKWLVSFYRKG